MPVIARRHIRRMRGGAQSHLIEASDGGFYVVKFQNNPQHRRILVNELTASVLLRYLQVATPDTAIIQIDEAFLRENPEVSIELGTRRTPVTPGWHFGSKYPGDPSRLAVYDFLPDTLLQRVENLPDFLGALVFDKWTANADGRQSVFFRARVRDWQPAGEAHALKLGFIAVMIDHGYIFNGPHWDFPESPVQGLYPRRIVYEAVRSLDDLQPWLEQVVHFPEEVIDRVWKQLPAEWMAGDEDEMERLLEKLLIRRKRVPDLLADARRAKSNPFPNWN